MLLNNREETAALPAWRRAAPARAIRRWRRASLRRQIVAALALPMLVVALAAGYVASVLGSMSGAIRASTDSADSTALRYALLTAMVDAETGLRGYLLSGDPDFLAPYSDAPRAIARIYRQLEATERGEPEHMRTLLDVGAQFEQWRRNFAGPLITLRTATPVGVHPELVELRNALASPSPATRQQALGDARVRLDPALARVGNERAQGLRTLLLALHADPSPSQDALRALDGFAQAYRADERRIVTRIQSAAGKHMLDAVRALLQDSLQQERVEREAGIGVVGASVERARWVSTAVPAIALLLGLSVVLVVVMGAAASVARIGYAAEAVAAGHLERRVEVRRDDEIGRLAQAFNRMAAELHERQRRTLALDRLQSLLLGSNSLDEVYEVTQAACRELFPGTSGALYRIAPSRDAAERVAAWDWPGAGPPARLDPRDCRAIRGGQPYFVEAGTLDVPCPHLQADGRAFGRSGCLPLSAQGEVFGILQLVRFDEPESSVPPALRAVAMVVAEQLAVTVAGLELREQLRQQSIRDPLTGLTNRRFLEETMARELARHARNGQQLAVVALDIDHFKRFNDRHGHEAGDRTLVEVARVMRENIRGNDVACRYGGEEFVLLLVECDAPAALTRVQALLEKIRALRLEFRSGGSEPVTASAGVAAGGADGTAAGLLLRRADLALYAAKNAGRDRAVAFHPGLEGP